MKNAIFGHNEKGKPVRVDIQSLTETRALVQANSGGGKSWALRRLLEKSAGIVQQIVIDPEGEFATLREKYDYIICSPSGGDALVSPDTAKILARKLLETEVSAVVDIYDLKADDRKLFVKRFLEALVNAPRKLWHPCLVILDEAHVFAPQIGDSASRDAVIDIATRGRKRGFGLVAATQRLSKLHKDVAAELLNKAIGRTSLDIDVKRAADELGLTIAEAKSQLRRLRPGDFFVYGPAFSDDVTRLTVGPVATTHPKVGDRLLKAPPAPSAKIKKILGALEDIQKEADAEVAEIIKLRTDNTDLRRQNAQLKRGQGAPQADEEALGKAHELGYSEALKACDAKIKEQEARIQKVAELCAKTKEAAENLIAISQAVKVEVIPVESENFGVPTVASKEYKADQQKRNLKMSRQLKNLATVRVKPPVYKINGDIGELTGPEQRILDAVAWLETIGVKAPNNSSVAFMAGYRPNGGAFTNPRGRLRSMGLVTYASGGTSLTDEGRQKANFPSITPTNDGLQKAVLEKLSGPERRILQPLIHFYPRALSIEELASASGYSGAGGAFTNPRGRLKSLGLAIYPSPGQTKAADILFPEGG